MPPDCERYGILLGDYTSGREALVPMQKPPAGQATLEAIQ